MPQFRKAFLDSSMHARKERRVGQICMKGLMHLLIHRNRPWQRRNLRSQHWEGDFCEYLLQNRYRQTTKQHNKLTSGTELLKKLPRSITKQQVPHLVVRRPTAYRKLEAEEWKGLSLDESAFDIDRSEADAMAAVKVVDSDDEPPCGSFTGQLLSSNPISVVSKRTLCRNPTRSPKYRLVLCLLWRLYLRPSSAPAALFSRLSYSHRNSCRIDSTPTRRGQNCLDNRLVKSAVASADWEMLWSGACGLARPQLEVRRRRRRLTAPWSVARATGSYSQAADSGNVAGFSTPPPRNLSPKARGAYLRRSSTLPVSNFGFQSRSTDACGRQLTIQVHQTTAPPYTLTSHSPSRFLVQGPDHPNVKLHRRYPSQRHLR
jgi:hypothetical protein